MISLEDNVAAPPTETEIPHSGGRGASGPVRDRLLPRRVVRAEGGRMLRFGGVGAINTVTDFAVFSATVAVGAAPAVANLGGFLAANLQSYLLNARITFGEHGRAAPTSVIGYLKFLAAHGMSLVVSTVLIVLLAPRVGALPAKAAAIGFALVWNYAASAVFVFSRAVARPEKESGKR